MRFLLVSLALLFSGVIQAAPVTINFENNSYTLIDNDVYSKGFKLNGAAYGPSAFDWASVGGLPGGNQVYGVGDYGGELCNSGGCNFAGISIRRDDGGAFALYSLDYELDGIETSITGLTMENQAVTTATAFGTGGWLNLKSVSLDASTPDGFSFTHEVGVTVDNIVVSAVPVPPAVWLFGSALGGLGWFRRKTA
jgi:hypothetical protein